MSTPVRGIGVEGWQKCRGACQKVKHSSAFPWRKEYERCDYLCYDCKNAAGRAYRAAKRAGTFVSKLGAKAKWTPERLQELRECIEAGMLVPEVAEKLGMTESVVICARSEHFLPKFRRRSSSRPTKVKCIAAVSCRGKRRDLIPAVSKLLRVYGLSWSQAAERLNVSKGVIAGMVDRYREEINAYSASV